MFVRTFFAPVFALALVAGPLVQSASAEEPKDKMARLLNDKGRGQAVVSFLHFGADYAGHKLVNSGGVNVGGRPKEGYFHLEYEYKWKVGGTGTDSTQVQFFFDNKGNLIGLKPSKTTAELNQPFILANLSIKVLGQLILEAAKDQLTDAQIRQLQQFINAADAKGLLEFTLAIDLAVGK